MHAAMTRSSCSLPDFAQANCGSSAATSMAGHKSLGMHHIISVSCWAMLGGVLLRACQIWHGATGHKTQECAAGDDSNPVAAGRHHAALRACAAGMDEQASSPFRVAQCFEGCDMLGTDSVGIAFGLDQPDLALDHDLPINSAITSVTAASNNPMPASLETFEQ